MRIDHANSRWGAPRLIGSAALLLGILVVLAISYAGSASAVVGPTDLSISKSDAPDPVVQGNNVTYTVTVTNNGTGDATNVVVTDNLPKTGEVDYISATPSQGTCTKTGQDVTCNLGQLNANTSATITIVVKTKKAGTITNTATVSSPEDTTANNNSATATTTVLTKGQGNQKGQKASCAAPTIRGTSGNDTITGTDRADVIVTFAGDDQVFALGGKDLVCTGTGFDYVAGGSGGDTIIGGFNRDRLIGGSGGDLLKGKAGRDRLKGKSGNDTLNGGANRDKCRGGKGFDILKRCP